MIEEQEYAARRERLGELLTARNLDALFVPPSSDLEYLTGIERDLPTFGNISYAHGWVTGAFLAPGREPVYVLPRMFVRFHLDGKAPPGAIVVEDDGDGRAAVTEAVGELGSPRRIALGQRTWAETAVELLAIVPGAQLAEGSSLVNELRRVKSPAELELMAHACQIARETMAAVEQHRTVPCGGPPAEYEQVMRVLLEAQEAGRAAAVPGALAREVNTACRGPIEAAGLGGGFRHRMGHGIGLDVHERPFLSVEDETPLAAGMTFTDEPSIALGRRFAVRVEDVIVVSEGGGLVL